MKNMIESYIKIAWRNLLRSKTVAIINLFGLTVGLAACMLIVIYILHENSYDRHFKNSALIYEVGTTFIREGKEDKSAGTPFIMGETMQQEFPEIQSNTKIVSLFTEDKTLLRHAPEQGVPQIFYEPKGYIADSAFFNIFSYDFSEGNPATALISPKSIVLSEEIARKIFGTAPALNKIITVASNLTGGDSDHVITGVYKQSNKPSHLEANFFLSYKGGSLEEYITAQGRNFVNNNMFLTYLQLKPGTDAKKLEAKFPEFIKKYAAADLKVAGLYKNQFLTNLTDLHLHSGMEYTATMSGNLSYLYILASVALFILLIACINFMNLATARSSRRSAEVGVRKVLGAEKSVLIKQFLSESVLLSIIAFCISVLMVKAFVPVFSSVSGKTLTFSFTDDIELIGISFLFAIITGFVAGSYPAFYLSSFKPVKVLKGKISNTLAAVTLRKGLVVFQFVVSAALISATIVIQKQMLFMRSKDLGFAKEQQIVIPLRSEKAKKAYTVLKNEVLSNKDVLSVGASVYYPGIFNPEDNNFYRQGQDPALSKRTRVNRIDENFLQTLEIKLLAGRLFSSQFSAESNRNIIINETAVYDIGFTSAEQCIGEKLFFKFRSETLDYTIVGVVKDFHFEDLQQAITPYAFTLNERDDYNYLIVHGHALNIKQTLTAIENSWNKAVENEPFEYSFLDADFQKNYSHQLRISAVVSYFTLIAIVISCLGLFALAAFSAEQRIKEIGVRRVLGAKISSLVTLLSMEYLKLVILAAFIASPLAWYIMNEWLKKFAYRTTINWSVFILTLSLALFIAFVTIGFQTIRAAATKPVKSLRAE